MKGLVAGLAEYAEAATLTAKGIDNIDAALIAEATEHVIAGAVLIKAAATEIEKLRQD